MLWESKESSDSFSQVGKDRLTEELTFELNIEGGIRFLKCWGKVFRHEDWLEQGQRWKSPRSDEWLCMAEEERKKVGDTTQQGRVELITEGLSMTFRFYLP